jgi:outer membrane protein assembly factor BamB
LLLDNGDLWLFDPEDGESTRVARLGGYTPYPPHIAGDTIYIAQVKLEEGRGAILSFDLARRRTRWQVNLDDLLHAPLEVTEGWLFVSVSTPEGTRLLALDGNSGERLWEAQVPTDTGPPLAVGGRVYLAGKHVFAWEAGTGRLHWQSPDIGAGGALNVCGDALYVGGMGTEGPALVALDLPTGRVRWWSVKPVAFPYSRAACDPERDQVLVAGLDGGIHAYDAATGEERWTYRAGEPFLSELVIAKGIVYGVTGQATLVAVESSSGRLLARYAPPHADTSRGAPLLMGNRIYLVDGFSLYALEAIHE